MSNIEAVDYERAAEIIVNEGWRKGQYGFAVDEDAGVYKDLGSYCYMGGLLKAVHERIGQQPYRWIDLCVNDWREATASLDTPWGWNDDDAQSAQEVADKLMEVAKWKRNQTTPSATTDSVQ